VDPVLEAELEELTRQRLIPITFTEQVNAGLRLLAQQAKDERTRQAALLVDADRKRAEQTYRQVHGRQR
jgi:hypothetical protein